MKYFTASPYSSPLVPSNLPSGPAIMLDGGNTANNHYSTAGSGNEPFFNPVNNPSTTGVYCQPTWLSYKRDPLNISELSTLNITKAYPNPFHDELKLDISDEASIKVYNLLGKKLIERHKDIGTVVLNTLDWSKGIYFISITSPTGTETIQVIKQ
jgi:hypothetical protein